MVSDAIIRNISESPDILRDLGSPGRQWGEGNGVGGNAEPLDRVRRANRGMHYADDAGIVSQVSGRPCEDNES